MDRLSALPVVGASLALALLTSSLVWLVLYFFTDMTFWPLVIAAFVVVFSALPGYWGYHRVMLDVERMQFDRQQVNASNRSLYEWSTRETMPNAEDADKGIFERSIPYGKTNRSLTIVETLHQDTQKWYAFMSHGLRWAFQLQSLQSRELVGQDKPFASPEAWTVWKNVLVSAGMLTSEPGVGTHWAEGWGYGKAIRYFDNYSPIVFPARKAPSVMPWTGAPLPSPSSPD